MAGLWRLRWIAVSSHKIIHPVCSRDACESIILIDNFCRFEIPSRAARGYLALYLHPPEEYWLPASPSYHCPVYKRGQFDQFLWMPTINIKLDPPFQQRARRYPHWCGAIARMHLGHCKLLSTFACLFVLPYQVNVQYCNVVMQSNWNIAPKYSI